MLLSLNQRLPNLMSRKIWDYAKMIFAEIIYESNYHKKGRINFCLYHFAHTPNTLSRICNGILCMLVDLGILVVFLRLESSFDVLRHLC